MKLGIRIFGCYMLIFLICFAYPMAWVSDSLRISYLESVEDPLVDQANILAGVIGQMMTNGTFEADVLHRTFQDIYARPVNAQIYKLAKTNVDMAVYVTDTKGRVIFHSRNPAHIGEDYSIWRDVGLTLEGAYGARTTLADRKNPKSSILYVAAPIKVKGQLAGVLTVAKPTTNINSFLHQVKPQLIKVAIAALLAAIVAGYLIALWITRPIKRLTEYAGAVHEGRKAVFPKLDRTEIGTLGRALKKMQTALEGKAYVERYVQQLTHEIKSPLSAIRGSAELLEENVPLERRVRFLTHIRTEVDRIQATVDRMLTLAALENKQELTQEEEIGMAALVKAVVESKQPLFQAKNISVNMDIPQDLKVYGDPFWLHQAVANLVQNAIDFSLTPGEIIIGTQVDGQNMSLFIDDNGTSIPQYALEKVFDKFYSLKRPDSGRKSTGLGLNLVQQVALLHNGEVRLENRTPHGVRAVLTLPLVAEE